MEAMTDDTPQVEQRHREAAADYMRKSQIGTNATYRRYLEGLYDESNIVQAFARFEATHLATLTAERDALREALEPFARHVDKQGEVITLTWGESTYTGTLKPEDFYRASDALRTDAPGKGEG
jgi:hypothetical protein